MYDNDDLTRILAATSDPVRLEIIFLLDHGDKMNVGQISSHFRLSRPAISHHLKVLKDAGVVRSEKSGQEIFYWLDFERVVLALRALTNSDIYFPAVAANSFGTAAQAKLFQGNMSTKPGTWHHLGSDACTCLVIIM